MGVNPKVSIITVCFNSETTIRDTIESVLNQNYGNIEYIIIDGKSTDDTVCIAESYREAFHKKGYDYKIISEKDNGIYDAMNKGVGVASGKIIGIINSDDWYESNAVGYVADIYVNESFDMLYGDLRVIKNNREIKVKHSRKDRIVSTRHWNHPTSFITKKVYDSIKYQCKDIYDDFDLFLKIKKKGYKIVIKNTVLANFRVGGISTKKSVKECVKRIKCRYNVYRANDYNRLYIIECIFIEAAKLVLS